MLSYELAKHLKDARFPQGVHGSYIDFTGKYSHSGDHSDLFYCPTLEELIEACVQDDEYFKLSWLGGAKHWEAYFGATIGFPDRKNEKGQGKTPSEAVAKLWLQLNK